METEFSYHTGFLVPKHAPWKKQFNAVLSTLVERGFVFKLKGDYLPAEATQTTEANLVAAPEPFHLDHFLGPFIFLPVGLLVSALVLLREWRLAKKAVVDAGKSQMYSSAAAVEVRDIFKAELGLKRLM